METIITNNNNNNYQKIIGVIGHEKTGKSMLIQDFIFQLEKRRTNYFNYKNNFHLDSEKYFRYDCYDKDNIVHTFLNLNYCTQSHDYNDKILRNITYNSKFNFDTVLIIFNARDFFKKVLNFSCWFKFFPHKFKYTFEINEKFIFEIKKYLTEQLQKFVYYQKILLIITHIDTLEGRSQYYNLKNRLDEEFLNNDFIHYIGRKCKTKYMKKNKKSTCYFSDKCNHQLDDESQKTISELSIFI